MNHGQVWHVKKKLTLAPKGPRGTYSPELKDDKLNEVDTKNFLEYIFEYHEL
jgi:hypothetical protein